MFLILLLLFTLLPIVEIALLVKLGGAIGWPLTLLIALGTGALGAALARQQGLATLSRISRQMAAGEPPTDSLIDGAMILMAGAVLITPGVLTDAFGFALLMPPVRAVLKPLLAAAVKRHVRMSAGQGGNVRVWTTGSPPPGTPRGDVVDAEVIEVRTRDAESDNGEPR
ncbi:phage T7 F exclusion suppressor FxsA [Planctomycetes bacterium MalM25]|nr:phage T7 F exclusion suppressor FxsA [Planctomycetes bacterium MalM25]